MFDGDDDLVADWQDNCSVVANSDQLDTNLDGYGNACDTDYNDDGLVGVRDLGYWKRAFGSTQGQPNYDPDVDVDGDGAIGITDFPFLGGLFGLPPGPSGLSCAGMPPCF